MIKMGERKNKITKYTTLAEILREPKLITFFNINPSEKSR